MNMCQKIWKTRTDWLWSTIQLKNLTGSNTATYQLGNTEQSKGSLFYISPYVSKNKGAHQDCLTVMLDAQEKVKKYPSVAEDSGTDSCTVQHILTRILNTLNSRMEISDT